MEKTIELLPPIQLVGITARTNNAAEMNPATGKIGPTLQRYFQNNLAAKINSRKKPGTTYCVYTEYENDCNGDYTYFVGEAVSNLNEVDSSLETKLIPAQRTIKFTTAPGPMPAVCIELWQKIWSMTDADLGGTRAYVADFEVYDERSHDPQNTVLDIYIGILN
jgi:predicted transcriptional regulator YdeE